MFNVYSWLKIQGFKDIQIQKFLQLMRENLTGIKFPSSGGVAKIL